MLAILLYLSDNVIKFAAVAGMPICEAFDQIEQQPNIYDVVHVKYLDEVWVKEIWLIRVLVFFDPIKLLS